MNPPDPWSASELKFLESLGGTGRIHQFLSGLPYPDSKGKYFCRSPRLVMRERKAHCFEGALFAAAALEAAGYQPVVVNLRVVHDDEHVLAVFRDRGFWGAISKSNFITLGYREPIYRTLRELVISYFEGYFNLIGDKSLRSYSRPVNLNRFNRSGWRTTEQNLEYIGDYLNTIRHYPLLDLRMIRNLQKVDRKLLDACLLKANRKGLYIPRSSS